MLTVYAQIYQQTLDVCQIHMEDEMRLREDPGWVPPVSNEERTLLETLDKYKLELLLLVGSRSHIESMSEEEVPIFNQAPEKAKIGVERYWTGADPAAAPPWAKDDWYTVNWLAQILNLAHDTCDQLLAEQPDRDLLKHLNRPLPSGSTKVFKGIYRYHLARTHLLRALSLIIRHSRSWPLPDSESLTPMYRIANSLFKGDGEGLLRATNDDNECWNPRVFQKNPHVKYCQLLMSELGSGSHALDHSNPQNPETDPNMTNVFVCKRFEKGDKVKFKHQQQLTGEVEEDDKTGRPFKVKWTGNTSGPAEWIDPTQLEDLSKGEKEDRFKCARCQKSIEQCKHPTADKRLDRRVHWRRVEWKGGTIQGHVLEGEDLLGKPASSGLVHVKWEHTTPPEWCTADELVPEKPEKPEKPDRSEAEEKYCSAALLKYGRVSVNAEHEMARLLEYDNTVLSGDGHLLRVQPIFSGTSGIGKERPGAFYTEVNCLRALLEEQEQAAADCISNLVFRDANFRPVEADADGADSPAIRAHGVHVFKFDTTRAWEDGPRQIEYLLAPPNSPGLISTLNTILVNRARLGQHGQQHDHHHALGPTQGRMAATLVAVFIELLAHAHEHYAFVEDKDVPWIALLKKCKNSAYGDDASDEKAAMDLLAFAVDLTVSTQPNLKDLYFNRCTDRFTKNKKRKALFAHPSDDADTTPFEYLEEMLKSSVFSYGLSDPLGHYHTFRDCSGREMVQMYKRPFAEMFGHFYGANRLDWDASDANPPRNPLYEAFRQRTFRDGEPKRSRKIPEMNVREKWPSWYFGLLKAAGTFFSACLHTESFDFLFQDFSQVLLGELDQRFGDPYKKEHLHYEMTSECFNIVVTALAGLAQCKGVDYGYRHPYTSASATYIRDLVLKQPRLQNLNWTNMVHSQLFPHIGQFFVHQHNPHANGILLSPSKPDYDIAVSCLSSLLDLIAAVLDDFTDTKQVLTVVSFFKDDKALQFTKAMWEDLGLLEQIIEPRNEFQVQQRPYGIADSLIVLASQPLDLYLKAKVLRVLNGLAKGHNDLAKQVAREVLIPNFFPQLENMANPQGMDSPDHAFARLAFKDEAVKIQSYPVTMATLDLLVTAFVWTQWDESVQAKRPKAREMVFPPNMPYEHVMKLVESIAFYLEDILRASSDTAARMYGNPDERWKLCKTVLSVYHAFIVELPLSGAIEPALAERIRFFLISRLVGGNPRIDTARLTCQYPWGPCTGVNRQRPTIAQPHTTMFLLGDIIQRGYAEHSFGLAVAPLDLTICVDFALNILNAVNDTQQPFLDTAGVDGMSVGAFLVSRDNSAHVRHLLGFLRFGYNPRIAWLSTKLLQSLANSHPHALMAVIRADFTTTQQSSCAGSNFSTLALAGSGGTGAGAGAGTGTAVGEGFRREILSSFTSHISTSRRSSEGYDVGLRVVDLILDCLKGQRGEFGLGHLLLGYSPSDGKEKAADYAPQRTMLQALEWEPKKIARNLRSDRILAEACQNVFFLMCKQVPSRNRASKKMLQVLFGRETEATCEQPWTIYDLENPPDSRTDRASAMAQLGQCLQTIELFIHKEAQVVGRDFSKEIFDEIRQRYWNLLHIPFEVEKEDSDAPMGGNPVNHVLYSKNQSGYMEFGITNNEVLDIANEALANPDSSQGYNQYDTTAVVQELELKIEVANLKKRNTAVGGSSTDELKFTNESQQKFKMYLGTYNSEMKADFYKKSFFTGWCHTLLLVIYKTTDRDLYNSDRITETVCTIRDLLVRMSVLSSNAPGPRFKAVAGQHRQLAETVSYVAAELRRGVAEWRKRGAWKDRDDVVQTLTWKEFSPTFEKVFLGILLTDSWWGGDWQGDGQDQDAAVLTRTLYYNTLLHMIQISENAETLALVSRIDMDDTSSDDDTSFAGTKDAHFQAMRLAVCTMENAMFVLWRHLQYFLAVRPGIPGIQPRAGAAHGPSSTNAIERQPRRLDAGSTAGAGGGMGQVGSRRQPPSLDDMDLRREVYDAKILEDFHNCVCRRVGGLTSDLEALLNDAESDHGALTLIESYFVAAVSDPPAGHYSGSFVAEKSTEQLMRVVCYDALAQHTKGARALRVLASMIRLETQGNAGAKSRWVTHMSQHNTLRLLADIILKSDDTICAALRTGANLNYVMNLHEARMDVLLQVGSTTEGADQLARVECVRLLAMMKFVRDPRRKQIRAGESVALQDHAFQMIVQPVIKLLVSVLQSTKGVPGANRQEVVRQVLGFVLDNMAYFEKVLQVTETRCLTVVDLKEIGLVVSLLHQLTDTDASRLATQILGREYTKLMKDGVLGLCIWLGDYSSLSGWRRSSQILIDNGWDEWATLDDPVFSVEDPECVHVRRLLLPLMADTIGCVRAVMLPGPAGGGGLPTLNDCRVLFEPEFGAGVQSDRPNVLDHVVGIMRHAEHLLHDEKEQFKAPEVVAVTRPANFAGRASFQSFAAEAEKRKDEIPRAFISDLWTMVKSLIA